MKTEGREENRMTICCSGDQGGLKRKVISIKAINNSYIRLL